MFRNMASIRENFRALRLPDFCNLGTWLRVLLAVNGMALAMALHGGRQLSALPGVFVELAAYVEPITFSSLIVLCGGQRWLSRLSPPLHALVVLLIALVCATLTAMLLAPLDDGQQSSLRIGILTAAVVVVLLAARSVQQSKGKQG